MGGPPKTEAKCEMMKANQNIRLGFVLIDAGKLLLIGRTPDSHLVQMNLRQKSNLDEALISYLRLCSLALGIELYRSRLIYMYDEACDASIKVLIHYKLYMPKATVLKLC